MPEEAAPAVPPPPADTATPERSAEPAEAVPRANEPCAGECTHHLHRAPDEGGGRGTDAVESSGLCRNEIGVFHMVDCPLEMGRACTYFEARGGAPEPRPDREIAAARRELRRDFMGWSYFRRVRALRQERGTLPAPRGIEHVPEPEEVIPDELALVEVEDAPLPTGGAESEEDSSEELYPGQRRSEDRLKGNRQKGRARSRASGGTESRRDTDAGEDTETAGDRGDADFGFDPVGAYEDDAQDTDAGAEAAAAADEGPKTVEELLDALPEAHLPDKPARGRGAQRIADGTGGGRGRGGRSSGRRRRSGSGRGRGGRPARRKGGGGGGGDKGDDATSRGTKKGARPKPGERRSRSGRRRRGGAGGPGAPKPERPPEADGAERGSQGQTRSRRRRRDGGRPSDRAPGGEGRPPKGEGAATRRRRPRRRRGGGSGEGGRQPPDTA